jgi:PKD domain
MHRCDTGDRGGTTRLARGALLTLALCMLLAASASAAAPNWLEPADLSKAGRDASNPAVAMDAAGNTIAIWERESPLGPSHDVQISTRAAGGTFTTPVDVALRSTDPHLAVAPGGEAVAVWRHFENPPGVNTIQIATRPPGGSFGPPETAYVAPTTHPEPPLLPNPVIPQELRVAIGDGGDVIITWGEIDPESEFPDFICGVNPDPPNNPFSCPNPAFVMATVRPAGGVFTEAERISALPAPKPAGEPAQQEWAKEESVKTAGAARPAVDAAGNATVVWTAFDGTDFVIQTAGRPAGQDFTAPVQVSESGEDAGLADIGVDAAGNVIASWLRNDGAARLAQVAIKAPGGSFAPLGDVSPAGGTADRPALDVAANGAATLVWRLTGPTNSPLQSSTRPPGGSFSAPANLSSGNDNPLFYELAIGDDGDAIVVWSGDNGAGEIVRAAVRPAGSGSFGAPVVISQSSPDFFHPRPSMDAGGDATVVWTRDNGTHSIVQWAGYDADPPQLRDVSIPAAAKVGDTVQFSASSSDVWLVGGPSFDFGDGGHAEGNSVSHVYSAPGSYTVGVTAVDALNKTATATGTILVKARNYFTIGKLKKNRRKGTATLTVTIPEPGTLVASGRGIRKATVRSAKAGTVKVPLKAAGKGRKALNRKGRLKARLKVAYSPDGGDANSKQLRVTLEKKLG